MSTTSGMAPLTVTFTNTSGGQASGWQWDFGDGSGSTLQSPSHVYTTPGRYTVVLTASGPGGSVSKTAATSIVVSSQSSMMNAVRSAIGTVIEKPAATAFTTSSASGNAPFTVTVHQHHDWRQQFHVGLWRQHLQQRAKSGAHLLFGGNLHGGADRSGARRHREHLHQPADCRCGGRGCDAGSAAAATSTMTLHEQLPRRVTIVAGGCAAGTLLGDSTLGTDDQSPAGVATAFSTKASVCGTLASLSVFLETTSTATKLNVGLYSDANGHPGTLLAQGSTSSPSPGAWNTRFHLAHCRHCGRRVLDRDPWYASRNGSLRYQSREQLLQRDERAKQPDDAAQYLDHRLLRSTSRLPGFGLRQLSAMIRHSTRGCDARPATRQEGAPRPAR